MPIALNFNLALAYLVCAFAASVGWSLGTWVVHKVLK